MTQLLDRSRNPVATLFRSVWSPTPETMRWWALAAIVVNAGITVTGAVVRVTKSGLGCPTWPQCTPDSFVPAAHEGISPVNTVIEFGNRLLTFLVLAVAVACVIAARRLPSRRRGLVRLAWLQPYGVAVQALWGGVVVHTLLHPVTVSVHFLFSVGMMAAACALHARAGEGDGPPQRLVHRDLRTLGYVLVGAVLLLIVAGMVVTGTGPHSGDDLASRFPFDIETVARIHADVAYLVVGLTFALLFALHVTDAPGPARRAALTLMGVELAQGVIGYVQYFLAVPAFLVGLHVLGSTLVWICTLRVVSAMRVRGPLEQSAENSDKLDTVPV
ncbi:cytochrome b561 [Planobispora longispora]|uniref:Cytochrome b561 n=1 Tax=Planobispora longispora TaxID=28887 RepID=A0A8J3W621_9ACTN|nr:COX15/CtaA family protein [Planobispora longispora]BFE80276.1 COX15/CtaA family protein [Planobispora longispora]GIH77073.1 cytochrome b561 [Planobispora longispora]